MSHVATADSVIFADATLAAFTVTLPSASGLAGRQYTIKRVNSGSNNVTVVSDGAGWVSVGQGGTVGWGLRPLATRLLARLLLNESDVRIVLAVGTALP